MDRDWTTKDWERPFAAADRLSEAGRRAALACLMTVFPPDEIEGLRSAGHPLVNEQFWYGGRLSILELGLALAIIGFDERDVGRFRHPDQYEGIAAEFRAALLFARAGARLTKPEEVLDRKRCEFIAEFPGGAPVAVEVKRAELGKHGKDEMRVVSDVFSTVMDRLRWLSDELSGVRASVRFDRTVLTLGDRFGVSADRLARVGDDVESRARAAVAAGVALGRIDLGVVGSLLITAEPEQAGVAFDGRGPARSAKEVGHRAARNLLNDAIRKFEAVNLPGIILLDVGRDLGILNAIGYLHSWARRKPPLGALVLVDQTFAATDGRPYGNVSVIGGPRFSEVSLALASTLELCADGHCHYNPLATPSSPCPFTWLPKMV